MKTKFSKPTVMLVVKALDETFPREFATWLDGNFHIWEMFADIAHDVIAAGRSHYSSRTIIEVIRHHTALMETTGEYKLNDHVTPYLSRLFAEMYPDHAGLFAFRATNLEKATA